MYAALHLAVLLVQEKVKAQTCGLCVILDEVGFFRISVGGQEITMGNANKYLVLSDDVLLREVGEEIVLLNLDTSQYFSLNPVGVSMLKALTHSTSMDEALASLLEEYDTEAAQLKADLQELVEALLEQGLVKIV